MNNDTTIINRLWWLRKHLNDHFGDKKYKEVYDKTLNEDICLELDELIVYIKLEY
jgi:hypothetical protein